MDQLNQIFTDALRRLIETAGSQTNLSKISNVPQTRISEYLAGKFDFKNITIGTLLKLFPEIKKDIENRLSVPAEEEASCNQDSMTQTLLQYWEEVPVSKRYEILAQLAAEEERLKREQAAGK